MKQKTSEIKKIKYETIFKIRPELKFEPDKINELAENI